MAHLREPERAAGFMSCKKADVRWFLSVDAGDLPEQVKGKKTTYRSLTRNGHEIEFSDGFTELHKNSYREILAGRGFPLEAVRPSIEIVSDFRSAPLATTGERHPFVARYLS